jgi:hypothetical protein
LLIEIYYLYKLAVNTGTFIQVRFHSRWQLNAGLISLSFLSGCFALLRCFIVFWSSNEALESHTIHVLTARLHKSPLELLGVCFFAVTVRIDLKVIRPLQSGGVVW